jgi:hypothetical protein
MEIVFGNGVKNGNMGNPISRMNKRRSADMKRMYYCASKAEKLETSSYGSGKEKIEALHLECDKAFHCCIPLLSFCFIPAGF